ncbi:MAG: hypothetical protein U0610_26285 [bacterium]
MSARVLALRLVWVLAVATTAPAVAYAQAEGTAPAASEFDGSATVSIEGGDQVAARDKALTQALRAAVASAVVAAIGSDEAAGRQAELERGVLARSRAFVSGYQVTEEGASGTEYRVAVHARVAAAALARALTRAEPAGDSADGEGSEAAATTESSADVFLTGSLTAARYKAVRAVLERQVPGVRSVTVLALEPGAISLRVRGAFPARAVARYLSESSFGNFRLVVTPATVGPDVEVVVQDVEAAQ